MAAHAWRLVRRTTIAIGLLTAVSSAAAAQTQATFYRIPVSPGAPDPATAYSTTPYCTTNVGGTTSGFSFDFTSSTSQAALAASCPGTTVADFFHNFAVRFTGSLTAPSAGSYTLTLNSDDGTQVFINSAMVYNNFVSQGSGPGSITAALNGGPNPFTINYYENSYGGAYITFGLPEGVSVSPPPVTTTPEPSSMALLGSGLVGLSPLLRRRKR